MARSAASLELKLIGQRISRRISMGKSLAGSAWNPKAMEIVEGERILVISPHPDDDAIGCGGAIIKAVSLGRKVRILYLSLPEIDAPSREARKEEALAGLRAMGVTDFFLPEAEFPEGRAQVSALITKGMAGFSPDMVLVPSPLENHDQHLMAFEAYMDLVRQGLEAPTCMYEVWGALVPNLVVDITKEWGRKAAAIAAHASQVRKVDYVAMAGALNEYRAISCGLKGRAEAFLQLDRRQVMEILG
ncbi:MAG: PIG-L family deacetylase [Methanomassiliicoccales archaeon]|nr:PIG-L family deacetylase [Methanomassiliicoccales archaeon]